MKWGEDTDEVQYSVVAGTAQKVDLAGATSVLIAVATTGDLVYVSTDDTNVDSGIPLRLAATTDAGAWQASLLIEELDGNPAIWLHSAAGTRVVNVLRFYGE